MLSDVLKLALLIAARCADDVYWWQYAGSDCGKVDIDPQPACAGNGSAWGDLAALKRCCLATPDCGGFNTHNVIKNGGCAGHIAGAPCDLYLKQDHPQPPPPPPYPAPPSQRLSAGLWPLPRNASSGAATIALAPSFRIVIAAGETPTMTAIVKRYTRLVLLHGAPAAAAKAAGSDGGTVAAVLQQCSVSVASTADALSLGMDESYTLDLDGASCHIRAPTFVGAMYGLETLSQLVLSEGGARGGGGGGARGGSGGGGGGGASYRVEQAPWHIEDAPRFPFRGLMVDTARHYLPLNALRRQIDAMSFSKLNVLHWHMVDAQSYPFASLALPKLSMGAFAPAFTYSPGDVKAVVEYARVRGVQVLVEVDMPGHNYALGIGYPELIVNCSKMYPLETEFWCSSFALYRGEAVYDFVGALLAELAALLPNALFHVGGDEVQYQCWDTDPRMVSYLRNRSMSQTDLYKEFETRVFAILAKIGKRPMFWNSVYDAGVAIPAGAVVHSYQGGTGAIAAIAKAGHQVVSSGLKGYYVASQASWQSIFAEELMPGNLTAAEQARVLGGASAMWGETMDDSDIDSIVWPDTAAVAERLWSSPKSAQNPDAYDSGKAALRLIPHRCRLYQRGIRAKPIDDRDGFGRRRLQAQCEVILPAAMAASLPPLSALPDEL